MTLENPSDSAWSVPPPPMASGPATLTGLWVLAIDDDKDARTLLRSVLEEASAHVAVASSVPEALELVRTQRFDLVVSDIGMPGDYGYAFIRQLRTLDEAHGGKTPAVALTAFARDEDRQRALLAGFQLHLTKPIQPASLVSVLAALVGER